ncbi:protein takeout-like [Harmonia axyridis]|uniref:protein takeout-like n=1 Tax=Harmonia axyridis TaxID=115357 RepID=UPI001E279B06|nr:protein takeout-like [Harmonia axyridis]
MVRSLIFGFSFVFLIVLTEGKTIPKYIKKCSLKNPDEFSKCAVDAANSALPQIVHGDKTYKIPNLVPLKIDFIEFNPPGLKLSISNATVIGSENTKVKSIRYDKTTRKFVMDTHLDKLSIQGRYKVEGKVLVLPILGEGKAVIDFLEGDYHYSFDLQPTKKNGKDVNKVENFELKTEFGGVKFQLENLFNGNKQLSEEMEKFLTENWREVIKEFEALIVTPVREVVFGVFSGILNNLTDGEVFDDA